MENKSYEKTVITRFIMSKLLHSMNNDDKTNKEMIYIRMVLHCFVYFGARVSVVVWVSLTQNLTV